jgi:adenylosuccinate synthase
MLRRRAFLVVDLAFGDCGKGTIVDYLARRHDAHTVVRFNGGPQAGHNVVAPDGRHHTFSQFGSATFLPSVRTVLSRFMLIEPYALLNEAAHLRLLGVGDALDRLMIHERCPVITPAHQAANRLRELARGAAAHGTCGFGIGETMQDLLARPESLIYAADLQDHTTVGQRLTTVCENKRTEMKEMIERLRDDERAQSSIATLHDTSWIDAAVANYSAVARHATIVGDRSVRDAMNDAGVSIYEGAQGVLLDEDAGFHPHTTWSRTTFANANAMLSEIAYTSEVTRLGVLRTYFTRHGAGPMVTEDAALRERLQEVHNNACGWQGAFRVGVFDVVAARHAIAACGKLDGVAITHMDRLSALPPRICTAYQRERTVCGITSTDPTSDHLRRCTPLYSDVDSMTADGWIDLMQQHLKTSVVITSIGPTADDKTLHDPTF